MELEQLKQTWQEFQQKVDQHMTKQNSLLATVQMQGQRERLRKGLSPLIWGQIGQIMFGILLIIFAVVYWSAHITNFYRFTLGLIFHVYGVVVIMMSGMTLTRLYQIDYAKPVVSIQQQFKELGRWFTRCGAFLGLPWAVLWLPFVYLLFGIFGADLLGQISPLFLWCNIAVGFICIAAAYFFYRWIHRPGRESYAARFEESIEGQSLKRAKALLADLETMEGMS